MVEADGSNILTHTDPPPSLTMTTNTLESIFYIIAVPASTVSISEKRSVLFQHGGGRISLKSQEVPT